MSESATELHYTFRDESGYESGYESEGGTHYQAANTPALHVPFIAHGWVSLSYELCNSEAGSTHVFLQNHALHFYKNKLLIKLELSQLTSHLANILSSQHLSKAIMYELILENISYFVRLIQQHPHGYTMYPKGYIAAGAHNYARLFYGVQGQSQQKIVVLSPHPDDEDVSTTELLNKISFFSGSCFTKKPFLARKRIPSSDYRLMVEHVEGIRYDKLPSTLTIIERLVIFISAINTLENQHHLDNKVFIDLNCENIFYNMATKTSSLIDGGSSRNPGERLDAIFQCKHQTEIKKSIRKFRQIAPECWYIKSPQEAQFSMDVFSLTNYIFKHLFPTPEILPERLLETINAGRKFNPLKRPSLNTLRTHILQHYPTIALPTQHPEDALSSANDTATDTSLEEDNIISSIKSFFSP